MKKKGTIIYGVLNWGLGHATRSVSLIRELQAHNYHIILASDGISLEYLQNTFPECECVKLPSYNIKYSKGLLQLWTLGMQLPKIHKAMRAERKALRKLCRQHKPLGIISDNRLGFYHRSIPSVYITHQLKIIMPLNTNLVSRIHHHFIDNFQECWVPDFEGAENISGDIGHGLKPRIPLKYIGPASRFQREKREPKNPEYDIAAILSGPEPQRSILEEKLLKEFSAMSGKFLLIRGTRKPLCKSIPTHVKIIDLGDSATILTAVQSSEIVVSRSGYSSLMDYYFLGNRALLIPTPGQPEQEYLARYQLHRGRFGYVGQGYLSLEEDIAKAKAYNGFTHGDGEPVNWERLFLLFEGKGKS